MNIGDQLNWVQFASTPDPSGTSTYYPTAYDVSTAQAVMADFASRLAHVEQTLKVSNVGADNVLSQIELSPEAILISSSKIGIVGQVTFADWHRTISGQSTGAIDPSITQIIGGVIRTGQIQSMDGFSYMDLSATGTQPYIKCQSALSILANGNFTLGSGTSTISWDGTTLSVGGTLSAVTGSFGTVTVAPTGSISAGKSSFADVTHGGYWIDAGGTGGAGRIVVGSDTAHQLLWDGSVLSVGGSALLGSTAVSTVVSNAIGSLQAVNFNSTLSGVLSTGINNIVAATAAGTYQAKLNGTYATFQDANAVLGGAGPTTAGNKLALGIDASGIIAGYNAATTGAWTTTFLVDTTAGNLTIGNGSSAMVWNSSAGTFTLGSGATAGVVISNTGAATFAGTLAANSLVGGNLIVSTSGAISSGQTAYNTGTGFWMEYNAGTPRFSIGNATAGNSLTWDGTNLNLNGAALVSGTAASTLVSTANTANSNASSALTQLPGKLNNNAADVLSGNITFSSMGAFQVGTASYNGTTYSGTGIMFNQYGLVGVSGGTPEFVISSSGSATFSGTVSAATITGGTISGTTISGATMNSVTLNSATGSFTGGVYSTGIVSGGFVQACILGSSSTSGQSGVAGLTTASYGYGVWGESQNASSWGMVAYGDLGTGQALLVNGTTNFGGGGVNFGGDSHYWYFGGGVTTGAATATFASTNKPGSASSNQWITLKIDSTTVYIPVWT